MRQNSRLASACSALAIALACGAAVGQQARAADEVTQERLLNPDQEQGNWLLHHHDYSAHRFSPLSQINRDNAKNLKVA